MFRDLSRKEKQLPVEACVRLLEKETRGVLSVLGDDDYPYGMPMNHWYDRADGSLYFHSGRAGHRLDALKRHDKASFCIYDRGRRGEGEWAWEVDSVVVFGRIEIVDDLERVADITAKLSRKFTQDEAYIKREIELYASQTLLLRLIPEHLCGKTVREA